MAKPHSILSLLLVCFSLLNAAPNPDLAPLMAFKVASDASNKLTSWNATTDVCAWRGVTCLNHRVSRLVLENLDLHGGVDPLSSLSQLRVLSLKHNRLYGSVPDLSDLTGLKLLFLSHNDFTGEFPANLPSLSRLYRLDLSYNNFTGEIPATVNRLTHLLTLRLEENRFNGSISGLNLQNLQDFSVSGNMLAGEIPATLSGFPDTAFFGNSVLCGFPLQNCSQVSSDPTRPGSSGAIASPVNPAGKPTTVASSPSSLPANLPIKSPPKHGGSNKLKPLAIIAIIIGDILVLAVISLLLYCYFWRSYGGKTGENKPTSQILEGEKIVCAMPGVILEPNSLKNTSVNGKSMKVHSELNSPMDLDIWYSMVPV
ncbi:hypothetical protein RJ639_014788 [Escallonia herrerae]|uniref:Leucine-rich repeat-containing N-terminal plant-type domain-containing protein n=1 Tax=Escallonia herrerae TaxID=1293975 RepID=A0AA88VG80_9ASTE|nr:hypothetical protein RJ639_014788 [Escallonia herrerae]